MFGIKRASGFMLVLACAILFGGCPYDSVVPLGPVDPALTDDGLPGTWTTTEQRVTGIDSVELIIRKGDPGIFAIEHRVKKPDLTEDKGWSSEHYRAHITRVKGRNMLNVQDVKDSTTYLFFNYQLSGDKVTFSVVSDEAMKQKKKTSQELQAYFEENLGKKTFLEEERVFDRRK